MIALGTPLSGVLDSVQSLSPAPMAQAANVLRGASLGRIGHLEVRVAETARDVRQAQALRYRVFHQEMAAVSGPMTRLTRRDADEFDAICDHLLVVDHAAANGKAIGRGKPTVVGTYRLLRQDVADRHHGFYTTREFDIASVLAEKPHLRFLELGRSCVAPAYRTRRTVELLWQGIWAYVLAHRVDVMFGCASLAGTDPDRLAMPLSFLYHVARSSDEWRVRAQPGVAVDMNRMALEAIDTRAALQALPPLIKGYLRLGATIGDDAVVDYQFGTTDVCIVLPVANIAQRYVDFYGPDSMRRTSVRQTDPQTA